MGIKPIRVGFIGLSSRGSGWAVGAHLPYLTRSPYYQITALCNSSTQSAQTAAERNGLDVSKLSYYGNPADLAKDPNVDLIVCCVNVVQHYDLIKPALLAGKDVYCEWPLGSNLKEMEELTSLAEEHGSRTMVGLQGRLGVYTKKVQEYTGEKSRLGKILSSQIHVRSSTISATAPAGLDYFLRIKDGGNIFTINTIHLLDTMTAVLGGHIEKSSSILGIQTPTVDVIGRGTRQTVTKSTHDHILIQGKLTTGALFTYDLRGGAQFGNENEFEWNIVCEKGQIRLTCPGEGFWMFGHLRMKVHFYATSSVEEVNLRETDDEIISTLNAPADNVGRLYKAFATEQRDKYFDFKQGLQWARFIDNAYKANGVEQ